MKDVLLTKLRDKHTSMKEFREAAFQMGLLLAGDTARILNHVEVDVQTSLAKTKGTKLDSSIVLVPILRAGVALLFPFMQLFPDAKVGFVGMRRDERTAEAKMYYQQFPKFSSNDTIVVIDPMIATGGSTIGTIKLLQEHSILQDKIKIVCILAAPEGLETLKQVAPQVEIIASHVDEKLNDHKFIIPGLGDFGDRYFGTE